MKEWFLKMKSSIADLLRLDDVAEEEAVTSVEQSVEFRGAKLWVLMLAVFVASLGLNTNSAAVIIGAMLISPLMGPIIGMGLGIGIYDFKLLRRSWRNYIIATAFSIVTATVYFLVTPVAEVQSELLARTSPTIYDVLIALCGGLAGIVALCSRSQRTGNVIPGVAIATALMPPLCTVGFGLATANWLYAAGAMYLFLINTIFIVFATLVGVVFIMRFRKHEFIDAAHEKRVKRIVYAAVLVTLVPAIILTVAMVRESTFKQRIRDFVQQQMQFPNTTVVSFQPDYDTRSFSIVLIGDDVDSATIASMQERMPSYELDGVTMNVVQPTASTLSKELQRLAITRTDASRQTEIALTKQSQQLREAERKLRSYTEAESLVTTIFPELQILFPYVQSIIIAKGQYASADTTHQQTIAVIKTANKQNNNIPHNNPPNNNLSTDQLKQWLQQRTGISTLCVVNE